MPVQTLRGTEVDKLPYLLKQHPFVIVQWVTSRFVPCNVQTSQLQQQNFQFPIIKIDVDQNPKEVEHLMNKYHVAPIFPAISVFRFSQLLPVEQPHLFGQASVETTKHYYGQDDKFLFPILKKLYGETFNSPVLK